MKNLILFIFVALLLSACGELQSSKYMGLNGHVESVKEFKYEVNENFGDIKTGSLIDCTIYTFNSDGDKTNESRYDDSGNLISGTEYIYENGVNTKKNTHERNIADNYNEEVQYLVETKGDTAIWEVKSVWGKTKKKIFGNKKYSCLVTEGPRTNSKTERWFDKDGNEIELKNTYNGDHIWSWTKSQYKDGDLIQEEYLYPEVMRGLVVTYSYTDYDNKGNWIKRIVKYCEMPSFIEEREIKYTE